MTPLSFHELDGDLGDRMKRHLHARKGPDWPDITLVIQFPSRAHSVVLPKGQALELGLWLVEAAFEK